MRIRQSDLASYQRCAEQEHLYLEAATNHGQRGENLSQTVAGTVAHYAVMVMEKLHHEGRDDALQVSLATFDHYWEPNNLHLLAGEHPELEYGIDVWLPRQTWGGLRARIRRALTDYYEVLKKDDGILLALEHHFVTPIWVPMPGHPEGGEWHELTGQVDRLTLRFFKRHPILSVEDFKTGKKPTYLRFSTQWTVYSFASTDVAFWADFEGEGFEEVQRRLVARGVDLYKTPDNLPVIARRGRWLSLANGFEAHDAGWRTEHDYARLRVHLREYIKAKRADVHPLTVSGQVCLYCPFSRNGACGGAPIPELESGAPA